MPNIVCGRATYNECLRKKGTSQGETVTDANNMSGTYIVSWRSLFSVGSVITRVNMKEHDKLVNRVSNHSSRRCYQDTELCQQRGSAAG
jgi:hypothetical protein